MSENIVKQQKDKEFLEKIVKAYELFGEIIGTTKLTPVGEVSMISAFKTVIPNYVTLEDVNKVSGTLTHMASHAAFFLRLLEDNMKTENFYKCKDHNELGEFYYKMIDEEKTKQENKQ